MLDYAQLEALLAVEKAGSFEGAAILMGMTPIGVSRRIGKLEARVGAVLLERKPTRPSEAGTVLCRYAESIIRLQDQFLHDEYGNVSNTTAGRKAIPIAVDEQSLSCWFGGVLSEPKTPMESSFSIACTVCDQSHSVDLMRCGEVVAALSDRNNPVYGFRAVRLTSVIHHAVASPKLLDAFFNKQDMNKQNTPEFFASAPSLRRSNRDGLLHEWVSQAFQTPISLSATCLPSTPSITEACLKGIAWSVLPECAVKEHLVAGQLVKLMPDQPLEKDLYWHFSTARVAQLSELTASVTAVARTYFDRSQ